MSNDPITDFIHPPIVIGGVGGSGTRLIAECLSNLNILIGHDLNNAKDNLLFTLIFKRAEILTTSNDVFQRLINIFTHRMAGKPLTKEEHTILKKLASKPRNQHSLEWLQERANTALKQNHRINSNTLWGWKEPNSHIILERLTQHFPKMKYIHVTRNGLDMAYSSNQNQLELWGRNVIGDNFEISPYYSLKYWCKIHQRLDDIKSHMNGYFYLLNYDSFCTNPEKEIDKLLDFLGIETSEEKKQQIQSLVKKPSTIGRYINHDMSIFSQTDIAYIKSLGFKTE